MNSGSEISAITSFVARGGTVIVLDDFGYSSGIADEVGISYSNHRLYDDEYAVELDYNYVWMNISQNHSSSDGCPFFGVPTTNQYCLRQIWIILYIKFLCKFNLFTYK